MLGLFLGALSLTASFAVDLSRLYLAREKDQLVSDLAALGAINTPAPINGDHPSATAIATAKAVAAVNGIDPGHATLSVTAHPAGTGAATLMAAITDPVPLPIGLLSIGHSADVSVASWAEPRDTGGCFRSQTGPTNIYGTAIVDAPACKLEAKTFFYACGQSRTTFASTAVGYTAVAEKPYLCSSASYTPGASAIRYSAAVTDTIATSLPVTGMLGRLDAMAAGWPHGTVSPVLPAAPPAGTDAAYTGTTAVVAQRAAGRALKIADANLTFLGSGGPDPTCAAPTTVSATVTLTGSNTVTLQSGCYVFGGAFNANAASVTRFVTAPGASVVLVLRGGTMTVAAGAKLDFGDAAVYINGGSISNGGTRLSFGNGAFYLWGGTIYNRQAGSTLAFGNGPFYFYGGSISNTGTMTLGNGPFAFQGGSLALNAGSTTRFGVGDMLFYGGSVVAGGDAVTFGYGGSATEGSGAVLMSGGTFSLTARSLTAIGTSFGFKGGTLSLLGIGTIVATAPTAPAPTLAYRNLLFGVWGGAFNLYQSDGQQDTMSGLVYAPATNASIYGSQTITLPESGCFGVISGVLDIYQSARVNGAPCAGFGRNGAAGGMLVQ